MKGLDIVIASAKKAPGAKAPADDQAEPSDSPGQMLLDALAEKDAAAIERAIRLIVQGDESDDEDLDEDEV